MRGLVASFGHALAGLAVLLRSQRNARIHLGATIAVLLAGIALGMSRADWLWLTAAIGMVWAAEAVNTAVETLCDTLHPGRAEGIRRVKDLAAGSVLAAAITAAAIGILVFWPHIFG